MLGQRRSAWAQHFVQGNAPMLVESEGTGAPEGAPGWRFAVGSGILGWILDAFDFFVVVFLLGELAARYAVSKDAIVWTMTLTLAMRPVGALLFGAMADKFGRRWPLIACVVYFSCVTVATGLAPTYGVFLACRCLYGIGMGGYWGIGASYAMESAPLRKRGVLSGLMQAGYPFGYLLAAVGMQTVAPRLGWHAMFFVGSVVAVVIVVLTLLAPESAAWTERETPSLAQIFRTLFSHMGIFVYLLAMMTMMTSLSHGTQDLYPDFLKSLPRVAHATVMHMQAPFGTTVIFNIGAIVGALCIGQLSERIGRRNAIMLALGICLLALPAWAFGTSLSVLVVGAFFMQSGVQGAFGVIPAHLNELSPDSVRGLFPGFVYQLGVLISSPVAPVERALRGRFGYPWALAIVEIVVILTLLAIFALGPEKRGRTFSSSATA